MKKETVSWFPLALVSAAALALAGCWTPPNANVQPKAEAGLIADSVEVESVKDPATVLGIERVATPPTISLTCSDGATRAYTVGPKLKHFDQLQVGDTVKAKVNENLTIYALANGTLLNGTTGEALGVNARVMLVDPSYRLLTLQFTNGQRDTVKVAFNTDMRKMEPGDSVVVKPLDVRTIKIEKH
jgi:hypothetical protein